MGGDEDEIRQARFEQIRAAYNAGLFGLTLLRARRYLDRHPVENPLDGLVWYWLGKSLAEFGRNDDAEVALANALRLWPATRRLIPLNAMGKLHEAWGHYEEAGRWFRRVIEDAPKDATGYIYLGIVLARQGRLDEAEGILREAVATCYEGCLEEAFLNLGLVLLARERFDEAAECFREAIRLDPGYRDARRALRDVERCLRWKNRPR